MDIVGATWSYDAWVAGDLARRRPGWLDAAALVMAEAVAGEWKAWKKSKEWKKAKPA